MQFYFVGPVYYIQPLQYGWPDQNLSKETGGNYIFDLINIQKGIATPWFLKLWKVPCLSLEYENILIIGAYKIISFSTCVCIHIYSISCILFFSEVLL